MKITNIAKGPRGVSTVGGTVYLNPGETQDLELSKAEADGLAKDWFKVGGNGKTAKVEEKLAGGEGGGTSEGETESEFKAVHRGAGSFSIMNGVDEEVVEKITKAEAEKFNAMSVAEKAAYVEEKTK